MKRFLCAIVTAGLPLGLLPAQGVLVQVSTVKTGTSAEIVAFDSASGRLFIANLKDSRIDVVDVSDPAAPVIVTPPSGAFGLGEGTPTCVAVGAGAVAVSVTNPVKTDPGKVMFFDADGSLLSEVTAGALPDMLRFTPDGSKVVVANEGEPNDDYTVDPEGSISIIDVSRGAAAVTQEDVRTADFQRFNPHLTSLLQSGVRIYGPGATVAQDLEPEYVAISEDCQIAWVTLQENNAIAVVDIDQAIVRRVLPLGYKPQFLPGRGLDASDKDKSINIQPWPVFGIYQPDAIASYQVGGQTFLVTANEGDLRGYTAFNEETTVGQVTVDAKLLERYPGLQDPKNLGRLKVSSSPPEGKVIRPDGSVVYKLLFSFGGRSFSIWSAGSGSQVYDSGDDFEQVTADRLPANFNSNNSANNFDNRSDDKGPEPEGLVLGHVNGTTYAFIALERIGGIMVYDISDPFSPAFVDYVNNRNFAIPPTDPLGLGGDSGPEGMIFVPAVDSPSGETLLVLSNEVSGTVTIYRVGTP